MKCLFFSLVALGVASASASALPESYAPSCPPNGTLQDNDVSPSGLYEISAKHPDQHYPPSLYGKVTPGDFCFITNLELPASAAGKTCTLKFLFPTQQQALQPYKFEGPGHFNFTGYPTGTGADDTTTYNNQPAGRSIPAPPALVPGKTYTIFSGLCDNFPQGEKTVTVGGSLCSDDTTFEFMQKSGGPGCPLGFFVEIS